MAARRRGVRLTRVSLRTHGEFKVTLWAFPRLQGEAVPAPDSAGTTTREGNLVCQALARGPAAILARRMNPGRVLIAGGLAIWIGVLVAAAGYVRWKMRFPKSLLTSVGDTPVGAQVIAGVVGLGIYAAYSFSNPNVALVANVFVSGLVLYVLAAYVIALTVERRRAKRLGLPEPGTGGTVSIAESAVFLAIALPFAVAALLMTVDGIANEVGGNGREGLAALGLGAMAWFIAIVMGLFGLPLFPLLTLRRRS